MQISPVGYVRSPYKQKFAIPRQPGLVGEAVGEIIFAESCANPNCLREIEQFSHLWILFQFHETAEKGWAPTVQPPRLGGRKKVGVFASRSTFRPNGIGLSVVTNRGWFQQGGELILRVGGIDLLDETPIIDIKPYLPYADCIEDATAGYAEAVPGENYSVIFTPDAEQFLTSVLAEYPELRELITGVLKQDPRPAWRKKPKDEKTYGMELFDINIKWRIDKEEITVFKIEKTEN